MSLTVAVQMDPIQNIRIAGDTTFALLLEAQRRGHALVYYTPDRLSMQGRRVTARVERLKVQDVEGAHFTLAPPERQVSTPLRFSIPPVRPLPLPGFLI